MEIAVRLTAKDMNTEGVFAALETLCKCFRSEELRSAVIHPTEPKTAAAEATAAPTVPPVQQPPTAPTVPPVQQPPTAPTVPPVQTPPTAASGVPVSGTQRFTIPQVAQAAAVFAETSDIARQQIYDLIHSYGANALTDIPQDKLGEFATRLRGLGARI